MHSAFHFLYFYHCYQWVTSIPCCIQQNQKCTKRLSGGDKLPSWVYKIESSYYWWGLEWCSTAAIFTIPRHCEDWRIVEAQVLLTSKDKGKEETQISPLPWQTPKCYWASSWKQMNQLVLFLCSVKHVLQLWKWGKWGKWWKWWKEGIGQHTSICRCNFRFNTGRLPNVVDVIGLAVATDGTRVDIDSIYNVPTHAFFTAIDAKIVLILHWLLIAYTSAINQSAKPIKTKMKEWH